MFVNISHPQNALLPIEITEDGMVILVNLSHPKNALSPIEVTEEGMVTLTNLWFGLTDIANAESPITVTGKP